MTLEEAAKNWNKRHWFRSFFSKMTAEKIRSLTKNKKLKKGSRLALDYELAKAKCTNEKYKNLKMFQTTCQEKNLDMFKKQINTSPKIQPTQPTTAFIKIKQKIHNL